MKPYHYYTNHLLCDYNTTVFHTFVWLIIFKNRVNSPSQPGDYNDTLKGAMIIIHEHVFKNFLYKYGVIRTAAISTETSL